MLVQKVSLINFRSVKTFEERKKDLEKKITELQEINEELNLELIQSLENARAAEIKYIVSRTNRNRLNGELAEIRSRVYDSEEALMSAKRQYRSMLNYQNNRMTKSESEDIATFADDCSEECEY